METSEGKPFVQAKEFEEFASTYAKLREAELYDNTDLLKKLAEKIKPHSSCKILDLGCGSGIPVLKFFNDNKEGCELTGIDISESMIKLAKENVPGANVSVCDIRSFEFMKEHYHMIVSFYCLFAVSVDDQYGLFQKMYDALIPGGTAFFSLLPPFDDKMEKFEGQITFHERNFWVAYAQPDLYRKKLTEIGFDIELFEILEQGKENMLWVMVNKPT